MFVLQLHWTEATWMNMKKRCLGTNEKIFSQPLYKTLYGEGGNYDIVKEI